MRQKLFYSSVLGGLLGYAFTFHLLAVFYPFAPVTMENVWGKLIFLICAVLAFSLFAYLIASKLDFSAFTVRFPMGVYRRILIVLLLVFTAFALALGWNYLLNGWFFPPTSHHIEVTYIGGYVKITRILLPGRELVDFSTIEYSPEDSWEIDTQNVNAIRPYARMAFSTGNIDYVKFFFSANSEGLIYFNIDGRMQPVVVRNDVGNHLQPLSFLNVPSRFGKFVVLSLWGIDALLFFGLLFIIYFVKGWQPSVKTVVLPYAAKTTGIFCVVLLFFPYSSSSTYPWFNPANICFLSETCHFLLLPDNTPPWWFLVSIVTILLAWELADQYRRGSAPVVFVLGGFLAVVILSVNFANDLERLPLSLGECLSGSADGCLFQHRPDHSLDQMYGRRTAIQVAGYLNEHFPGSKLVIPRNLYIDTFYWLGLQPGPVFEGEMEIVSTKPQLTLEEEAQLLNFADTYYPQLQETDETDYPIYLIHPEEYTLAPLVFIARLGIDGSVIVYPEGLLP